MSKICFTESGWHAHKRSALLKSLTETWVIWYKRKSPSFSYYSNVEVQLKYEIPQVPSKVLLFTGCHFTDTPTWRILGGALVWWTAVIDSPSISVKNERNSIKNLFFIQVALTIKITKAMSLTTWYLKMYWSLEKKVFCKQLRGKLISETSISRFYVLLCKL